ncbi:MAG TPA: hypothetical protein PLO37_00705 [Candidatus Hydrogenedentes bacterium]|nr:hypothetical protein [Candidatus Hydrogenedentota bacterium]HPG65333.1 hypothetical protein [Candidatus Hydrogenedentota bacterium]
MTRQQTRFVLCAAVLTAGVVGCATVPAPFVRTKPDYEGLPADALHDVALEIEQAVAAQNREPDIPDRDGVIVNTELIQLAIRMRAGRFEQLNAFLTAGYGVEKRNGHIYILHSKEYKKETTRRQRNRDAQMIQGETENRWTVYEGIVKASGFPKKALSAVQEIFHEARLETLAEGQKFESPSGDTVEKTSGDAKGSK